MWEPIGKPAPGRRSIDLQGSEGALCDLRVLPDPRKQSPRGPRPQQYRRSQGAQPPEARIERQEYVRTKREPQDGRSNYPQIAQHVVARNQCLQGPGAIAGSAVLGVIPKIAARLTLSFNAERHERWRGATRAKRLKKILLWLLAFPH